MQPYIYLVPYQEVVVISIEKDEYDILLEAFKTVEIIEGAEIIEISGLTVKGLKAGTAVIRVSATTVISEIALEQGEEEKIYSTTAQITVR